MRSAAMLIAGLLPDDTASQIRGITAGRELQTTDDLLRPVDNPELPQIARILPADTGYQIVRAAGKLGFDVSDVLTVVVNAVSLGARSPKGQECALRDNREHTRLALSSEAGRSPAPASRFPHCLRLPMPPARAQGLARNRSPSPHGGSPAGNRRPNGCYVSPAMNIRRYSWQALRVGLHAGGASAVVALSRGCLPWSSSQSAAFRCVPGASGGCSGPRRTG